MKITELVPGQELRCWSKLGLAITQAYAPGTKKGYMQAPAKAGMAKASSLTHFGAFVYSNNTSTQVLSLSVYPLTTVFNSPAGESQDCALHYSYFKRIRLLSPINYPGKPNDPRWPTNYTKFSGDQAVPYRTLTEVALSW